MIFITGCPRSGTTLTARILCALGCYPGPKKRVNKLYENLDIRELVVKPYLKSIGVDPFCQRDLPDTDNLPPWPSLREDVLKRMGEPEEPWLYKCPKMILLWPAWRDAFPEAKYVLVRRSRRAIAESCMRTDFMRAYDSASQWEQWVAEHEARIPDMKKSLDLIEVWTDRTVRDPESFKSVAEFCGLPFDLETVRAEVDENLWHGG